MASSSSRSWDNQSVISSATILAFGVARLATALPAGALADRLGPRAVMIGADLVRAVAVSGLAVVAATGRPAALVLAVVGGTLGAAEGCYRPAWKTITPTLVAAQFIPAQADGTCGSTVDAKLTAKLNKVLDKANKVAGAIDCNANGDPGLAGLFPIAPAAPRS